MKLKKYILLFFALTILPACNSVNPKEHLGKIYSVAFDHIMQEDQALNHDMEFIAVDLSNAEGIDAADESEIMSYLTDKYNVEVLVSTLDDLHEQGLYDPDTLVLNGVLLKIENVDYTLNGKVSIEGSKYRAGDGGFIIKFTVYYEDGNWLVEESEVTAVS